MKRKMTVAFLCVLYASATLGEGRPGPAPRREPRTRPSSQEQRGVATRGPIALFLCGDVMTGRGIDQVLPRPCDPGIHESFVKSAKGYVALAERANGRIQQPVDFPYIWGDALEVLRQERPHVRIINLETSITRSNDYWKGKGIHYRMSPQNVRCITAAGIDVCTLGNNHVLDWGRRGLAETLKTLERAKVKTAGAGADLAAAQAPAVCQIDRHARVLVFSFACPSSGVPPAWAARKDRPGVQLLPKLSEAGARDVRELVKRFRRAGDLVVASIHWGGNWGYAVPAEQRRFAHRLIEAGGVDLVHGHSSHHVKGIEVYRGKLILYGCGDLINDYEGISGREGFRGDLGLMYFASLERATGRLVSLRLVPTRMRRFGLRRASRRDAKWLRDVLTREGRRLGTRAEMGEDGVLMLRWR